MGQSQLDINANPSAREIELLKDRIDTFNIGETKISDFKEIAIFVRDSASEYVAGIYAYTWGGCLDIRFVWVREDLRGAGLGSKLMQAVEHEAMNRGCHVATLETHSFQAPRFYQKLGYEEFGVLDAYPIGHKKHYMRKMLQR